MKKLLPILICLLFFISNLHAQWIQTNGPYGGNIKSLAFSGTNIFAGIGGGAGGGGIFLSTNNCKSWAPVNNGLPYNAGVNSIVVSGTNIFAGLSGSGVYLSTNNGINWNAVNNGLPPNAGISSLAISGTNIFAGINNGGGNGGIFLSTDNGINWTSVNNGLPMNASGVNSLAISDTNIFVGLDAGGGIYRSKDNGTSWAYCGLKDTTIFSLAVSGTNIFAGIFPALTCVSSVFCSTDNGNSWNPSIGVTGICNALAVSGTNILAGTSTNGIFLSTNNGTNWAPVNNGLPTNYWVYSIGIFSNGMGGINILAGNNRGVYLSTNNGESWTESDSCLTGISNRTLVISGTNLFAGTNSGVFISTNNGANWVTVNNGLSSYSVLDAEALAVSGTNLYAAIIPYGALPYGNGICLSTDNGTSWAQVCSNPPGGVVTSLVVNDNGAGGTNIFAGTIGGLFLSTNNGAGWNSLNSGLPTNTWVRGIAISNTNIFVGTWGAGIFISTNNGTSWTEVNNGLTNTWVSSLAVSGTNIYAGTNNGAFRSTDKGTTWTEINTGLANTGIQTLAVFGMYIFAGTDNGVYLFNNNGTNWTEVTTGLPTNFFASSLTVSNTNIFAGEYLGCVWRRPLSEVLSSVWQANITVKDNGNVSQSLSFGQSPIATDSIDIQLGEAPLPPTAFGFDARFHLPTGDESWKDYRFSNKDTVEWLIKFQPGNGGYPITFSWDTTKLPLGSFFLKDIITGTIVNVNMKTSNTFTLSNTGINSLEIVYVKTQQVVPVELTSFTAASSENNINISWQTATEKNNSGFEIQRSKDGAEYGKIGFVEGNGTTTEIHKYNFKDDNPPSGKLYYRLKQIDYDGTANYSNVIEVDQALPVVFSLSQNYPNPFNPSTVIRYGLPGLSNVKIEIYNLLGQLVESLVNGTESAGYHEVTWNAANMASGVYLYSIDAVSADGKGNYRSAKKLILMK